MSMDLAPDPPVSLVNAYGAHLRGVQGLAATSVTTYTGVVQQFSRWLLDERHRSPAAASVADIEAWVGAQMRSGRAPATRRLGIAALRSFYDWLPDRDDNPAARVRTPRVPPSDISPYDPADVDRILQVANARGTLTGRVEAAVLSTLRYTGLRVTELTSIETANVDLAERRLQVVGKGSRPRVLPLAVDLRQHLADYLEQTRPRCPPSRRLFASPRSQPGGRWAGRISPAAIRRAVRDLGEEAGVAGPHHPHRWRHTFATELLRAGVDVHSAQRLLGHVKVGTTAGYLHLVDAELRDAVDRVYDVWDPVVSEAG